MDSKAEVARYQNRSHLPESTDFLRNQDFFSTFVPNNLLPIFSDPNADPNGSGQRKGLYRARENVTHCFCRFTLGRGLCAAALLLQYGQEPEESCREIAPILAKNLTKSQIMRTIELLQKYRGECTYNVGTGHVLGAIAVELEGIL